MQAHVMRKIEEEKGNYGREDLDLRILWEAKAMFRWSAFKGRRN